MTPTEEKKFIDLERMFQSKNPGLYRWIPGFVFGWLRRIIHEEDLNSFMRRHRNDDAFQFCQGVLNEIGVSFESIHAERIPPTGAYIMVCNHPMGAMEAMSLVTELQKVRKDIKFIVNDLLLNLDNLKELFTGVNKHGKTALQSLKVVEELFASDQLIILFPAGLVSRRNQGVIQDLEWKKTFVTKARKYNKPVIPVYIEGRNSPWFYRIAQFRKVFGIKANIEMFLLVDEMYRQGGRHLHIVFGNSIEPATFTRDKSDEQWAAHVRGLTYALKEHVK